MLSPQEKQALRQKLLLQRREMDALEVHRRSARVVERLMREPVFERARRVMCYVSFQNEVETHALLRRLLADGREVAVPYIGPGNAMCAVQIRSMDELSAGRYSILEPSPDAQRYDASRLELILVPGVGFDRRRNRIGFGKGYYDRFLCDAAGYRIGLCYDFQVVSDAGGGPFDIPMDAVVTESETIKKDGTYE